MNHTMHDTTAADTEKEWNTAWDSVVGRTGHRVERLGDYLLKLGCRIRGDKPMGIDEAWESDREFERAFPNHPEGAIVSDVLAVFEALDEDRQRQLSDYAAQLLAEQRAS